MRFFTSDHHFGHFNIIKYCARPFSSVAEMNDEMLRRWNEVVGKDDEVFVLGDFSMRKHYVSTYLHKLNGVKHLIAGNHDECYKELHGFSRNAELIEFYIDNGFSSVVDSCEILISDHKVLLHHMPYVSSTYKDNRYDKYKLNDNGEWLVHGHVHDRWKIKGKQLNVGVDVWDFYPVPESDILKIIEQINKIIEQND